MAIDLVFVENPWINAGILFAAITFLSLIFLFVTERVVMQLTKKTKTDIDDRIVKKTRYPIFILFMGLGLKLILIHLPLTALLMQISQGVATTIIYVAVIYSVAVIFDILIVSWGKKWAAKTKSTVDDQVIILLHRAVSISIWLIGLLFIINSWGIEIGPLLASLGVAGIAVAFALQSTLGNIFGGISIILDKNIAVGDVVDIGGGDGTQKGKVLDIGLRSTKIKTFDGEFLVVPNGKLADSVLFNTARPTPAVRAVIPFGVAYGSDIEKVKKIVLSVLEGIEGQDEEQEAHVKFLEMGASSLNFKAYVYLKSYTDKFAALDKANTDIYNALNKNRIEIPFPQMDVHLKK